MLSPALRTPHYAAIALVGLVGFAATPALADPLPAGCSVAPTGVIICNSLAGWTSEVGGNVQSINLDTVPVATFDQNGQVQGGLVPSITTPSGVVMTLEPSQGFHLDVVGSGVQTGSVWANGETPFVIDSFIQNTLTLNLSANIPAFGLQMEPLADPDFATFTFDMSVTLSDGTVINSVGPVSSDGGAQFFGWVGAQNITSVTLQCGDDPTSEQCILTEPNLPASDPNNFDIGFGFGDLVVPVPEPASIALFGSGLVAFGAWRRRRAQASA